MINRTIKKLIKERGFSLADIGSRLSKPVTPQSVSALLSDDANPSINTLREIADILGISLAELLTGQDSPTTDFIGMIRFRGRQYFITSLDEMRQLMDEWDCKGTVLD